MWYLLRSTASVTSLAQYSFLVAYQVENQVDDVGQYDQPVI